MKRKKNITTMISRESYVKDINIKIFVIYINKILKLTN